MTTGEFRPLVSGAHAQTVLGQCIRTGLRWPYRSEDVIVDAGAVVRMNMRGCGDALRLCPRLYNAGLTSDLIAVFEWLSSRASRFAACGFSLGAGMTLLTLARHKRSLPDALIGAVTICPPLDMSRAADALELCSNRFYGRRFTRSLCASYRKRQALSGGCYEANRERGIRTLREFDDVVTAHYGGYLGAEHYYGEVSAGPRLGEIDLPVLVLASDNDPFIPLESTSGWPKSQLVHVEVASDAGHVGFVGPTRAPRFFWAGERAVQFLDAIEKRS